MVGAVACASPPWVLQCSLAVWGAWAGSGRTGTRRPSMDVDPTRLAPWCGWAGAARPPPAPRAQREKLASRPGARRRRWRASVHRSYPACDCRAAIAIPPWLGISHPHIRKYLSPPQSPTLCVCVSRASRMRLLCLSPTLGTPSKSHRSVCAAAVQWHIRQGDLYDTCVAQSDILSFRYFDTPQLCILVETQQPETVTLRRLCWTSLSAICFSVSGTSLPQG